MLLESLSSVLTNSVEIGGVRVLSSMDMRLVQAPDGIDGERLVELVSASETSAVIAIVRPLGRIRMFWKAGGRGNDPAMPADWAGRVDLSLVNSAPLGCMLDGNDRNVLSFAYSVAGDEIAMRYGVDEENAWFVVTMEIPRISRESRLLLIDADMHVSDVCPRLVSWMSEGLTAFPMSPLALEPVFSTWYAYTQRVDAAELERQAPALSEMGCASVFIDDGWQEFGHGRGYAGCGDWIPDTEKFPDLSGTVGRLRDQGIGTVLWFAPLLLGRKSRVFERLEPYAPYYRGDFGADCYTLDPRRRAVREYIAQTCARLMNDYGIDGLKIDFLEQAVVYQGQPIESPEDGDCEDVGQAMCLLLDEIRDAMLGATPERVPLVEFRQPYSGPAIAPYGNIIRACDCAADAIANRVRILDERLICGNRVVHSDMLLWDAGADMRACAEQLFSAFFSVPQLSVPPSRMAENQRKVCDFLLRLWRKHRRTLLCGQLDPVGVSAGYPMVHAYENGSQVTAVYERNMIVDVDISSVDELVVLNGSYDSVVTVRVVGGQAFAAGTARDCTGVERLVWNREPLKGLMEIPVPSFGVLELTIRSC